MRICPPLRGQTQAQRHGRAPGEHPAGQSDPPPAPAKSPERFFSPLPGTEQVLNTHLASEWRKWQGPGSNLGLRGPETLACSLRLYWQDSMEPQWQHSHTAGAP